MRQLNLSALVLSLCFSVLTLVPAIAFAENFSLSQCLYFQGRHASVMSRMSENLRGDYNRLQTPSYRERDEPLQKEAVAIQKVMEQGGCDSKFSHMESLIKDELATLR